METCPGEGVLKEEKFPHSRKPSHRRVCGDFWNLRRQQTRRENRRGKKKNPTEYASNCNCRKENFPTKDSNLMPSLARSQNKALSEHQRRASQLCTSYLPASPHPGLETSRARRQGAATISAPEMASSTRRLAA